MALRTCTIQLGGPTDPTVTSIPCVVTGSTAPGQNPVTVDAFVATNSFQANDGDVLTITGTQVNPAGPSAVSAPLEFVVASGVVLPGLPPPPPAVPLPPVIASITAV